MDKAFLTINGERHYLWRAVDQDDNVLDILVQRRRNKKAAKKFFKKLLKGLQNAATLPDVAGDHRHSKGGVRDECGAAPRPLYLVIASR
jgi:putative transposase